MIGKWSMAAICVVALVACREEEQGRVTEHMAGVYLGPAMPGIDDATRDGLRDRLANQDF